MNTVFNFPLLRTVCRSPLLSFFLKYVTLCSSLVDDGADCGAGDDVYDSEYLFIVNLKKLFMSLMMMML